MTIRILALAALLALAAPAWAQEGPVFKACPIFEWTEPITNTDGSPLTDLATYRVYVSTTKGQPGTLIATVNAASAAPVANSRATWACSATLPDGQKYGEVSATDTAGNDSARSAQAPFVLNAVPPSAPAQVQYKTPPGP